MNKRDFRAALREADQTRQTQTMSPAAERRLRQRIEAVRSRKMTPWMPWAMATLATATGIALAWVSLNTPVVAPGPQRLGAFTVADASAGDVRARADGAVEVAAANARLDDTVGGISIAARSGAVLQREPNGLRVLGGEVVLDVRKRRPGEAPAVVLVSHGAIEVLGTRFTITQSQDGGRVVLHEGHIRFRAEDGRTRELTPGQSLTWPLPTETVAEVLPEAPAPAGAPSVAPERSTGAAEIAVRPRLAAPTRKSPEPLPLRSTLKAAPGAPTPVAPDVPSLIEEITTLRRLGRFDEAAAQLEQALTAALPSPTRERLSYELGSILTWQLRDATRACEVWDTHRKSWPNGRYGAEVDRASDALSCTDN